MHRSRCFWCGQKLTDEEWIYGACFDCMCDTLGVSIMEVMRQNIAKLGQRYPEGFSTESSEGRHTWGED